MYRYPRYVNGLSVASVVVARRHFFGGGKAADNNNNKEKGSSSGNDNGVRGIFGGGGGGAGGMPPGFDAEKLRAMQELISSQPPEKQMEMMKKALEFQKTIGKIPGIGKLAQKNIEVMEHLVKNVQQQQQETTKPVTSGSSEGPMSGKKTTFDNFFPAQSAAAGSSSGPTIDELKKINLGSEIEALFAELKVMRAKKNSYRDKLFAREEELEKAHKELAQIRETDASLRAKLRKVEQEVMLINSENMELREHEMEWRQVRQKNKELTTAVERMQHSDAAHDRQRSDVLQAQLREKEDALRSLQRKLERLRRRDALLQFSRLCSDVARLCDASRDVAKDASDEAFAALQNVYEEEQERAWAAAAGRDGAAAHAYVAVVRRFLLSRVPHANYDALVAVEGDVEALRGVAAGMGFTLHHMSNERYIISAPAMVPAPPAFLGPYGISVGLYLAGKTATAAVGAEQEALPFRLTAVFPNVSLTLFSNPKRVSVHFDTARSSGPGGQAANVTETQITAKLSIDGETAYVAEAQDSRSALSNRETAMEKLEKARRQQFNEQLAKQQRVEGVEQELVRVIREQNAASSNNSDGGSGGGGGTIVDVAPAAVVEVVRDAVAKGHMSRVELALVYGMRHLSHAAAATRQSAPTQ
ncbi:type 11 methyltransferase [Trypanosoma grayi]|uniref:type 11 methyltransferase n=1 Tax=Trypanosoma grayi TaxID=71804 RepID=UPI0004F4A76B|nr:type 11 methyltransferase [Trypanosoma grayi]KEG09912.1 type 11 methyltransferase [Trypanosoma grayi]